MSRFISFCAAVALAVSCASGYEPDYSGDGGGNGSTNKPAVKDENAWAALADSCTFVLRSNFLNRSKGTFWSTPNDVEKSSGNIYWQQAHALDVLIASYERIKESDKELAATYLDIFEKWYQNDANNYNNDKEKDGKHGGFYNVWTDDMCWICLTLIKLTDATGITKYRDTARQVFDTYVWPRATKNDKGTGLPWTSRAEDANNKNACTNSPACLVAAKLFDAYQNANYLSIAKSLYDFQTAIMPDEERVEEPPLTYTQGTFGEACRVLWNITGDKKYMQKAAKVLTYTFNGNRCIDAATGILRHEGTDMDQSIFKAVYVPYAVNFVLDPTVDKASRQVLHDKLLMCAKALDKHLDRKMYPRMYCGYFWGETFTTGTPSMGAQASGASLMEGVARMVKQFN